MAETELTATTEVAERTAVTAADTGAQPPVEDGQAGRGKGDDLDALLAEFDRAEPKAADPAAGPKPASGEPDKPLDSAELRRAVEVARHWEAEQTARDIQTTVAGIKAASDDLADIPDDWIEARLQVLAGRDPKLATAWANRKANPAAWQRVQEALADKLGSEVAARGRTQAVQEREAATAATRGRTITAPPEKPFDGRKLNTMSDAEFADWKRSLGR